MKNKNLIAEFVRKHRLPDSFRETGSDFYVPLCEWVSRKTFDRDGDEAFVLGINGAQGTGKSTLADFIGDYIFAEHNLRSVVLSIDDLYLARSKRQALARTVHPLLKTRGVPGTHDVNLGTRTISALKSLERGQSVRVPRFDKSIDDRLPDSQWTVFDEPVDIVIFEGWCVGSAPVRKDKLSAAINELEKNEDKDGVWRLFVNRQLQDAYPLLFEMLDALVFLSAPDFDCVFRWRLEQEQKLVASSGATGTHVMSESEIGRFIQHYERITRQNLDSLPEIADVRLELGEDHQVVVAHYRDD